MSGARTPTPAPGTHARVLFGILLLPMLVMPAAAEGQLPSPARDAADELLAVVRTGDRDRIRAFIEERFTDRFISSLPMDQHVPIFASLGRQVEGLEIAGVSLDSRINVYLVLEGPGKRLGLRLRVEPEPPHKIGYLGWGDAGPDLKARSLDELGPELERLAGRPPFSGVVLIARGSEVLFHEAYGSADLATGRLNRPDTRFDIGSIYKLFTSTAVLRLAQDGRLELDDPVGKHLDGFPAEVTEGVTIRHLLQHRSGFGDYLNHPEFTADPKRFREPADFLPLARAQELAFEPGSQEAYSNIGYVLLGAIVEHVTGRGYHDVIEDLVFGPAGMRAAGPRGGAEAARRYELESGPFVSRDSLYADLGTPAGGGFATAMDLHRFFRALLDQRLLDEAHTALLLNHFEPSTDERTLPERFGFAGGAPGVHAIVLVRVAERQSVVVLVNIGPFAVGAFARRIEELTR